VPAPLQQRDHEHDRQSQVDGQEHRRRRGIVVREVKRREIARKEDQMNCPHHCGGEAYGDGRERLAVGAELAVQGGYDGRQEQAGDRGRIENRDGGPDDEPSRHHQPEHEQRAADQQTDYHAPHGRDRRS